MSLRPARRRWWRIIAGKGGRQASLCKHVVLVVKKQLVIHLQTRRQKMDIGFRMAGGGLHTTDPYSRIGARSEGARDRQRWGGRPIPRGERLRIVASAAFEGVSSGEVGPRVEGGSEDEAQAFQVGLRVEVLVLKLHRDRAR